MPYYLKKVSPRIFCPSVIKCPLTCHHLDKQTARERVDNVRKRARLLRDEKKRLKASTGGKASLEGE